MARMSQALRLRPVNSLKHVVDIVSAAQGPGPTGSITVTFARAVNDPASSTTNECRIGCNIKAIYLSVEAITTVTVTTGQPSIYFYVLKNPANEINLTNMAPDQVGQNARRKFVIHQEMRMMSKNSADNFPRTIFKGVIRIPQRYQRFGVDDRLEMFMGWGVGVDGAATADICAQCIYKEFF